MVIEGLVWGGLSSTEKTKEIPCHSIVSWLYLWSYNKIDALPAAYNNMRAL